MTSLMQPSTPKQMNEGVPILIVDDDPSKRFALKSVLAPLGYSIVEASSGVEALRCVIAQDFAVILMDIRMPDMDGFETIQLVRERQRSELTPVIFITGYGNEAEANISAYDAGAADFIYSPVPPQQLRAKVAMFANLYLRARHLASRAKKVQETANWLASITDAAPVGIFHTDEDQNYIYVNPRWTEITGITAEEALGRSWDIIHDPQATTPAESSLAPDQSHTQANHAIVDLEPTQRFEIDQFPKALRIVECSAKPLPSRDPEASNGPLGWVGTLVDVTDEVAAKASMAAAHDAAVVANLMQVNFTASASHELRTPTTSILGFIEEVLLSETLTEEDRGFLDIVHRNAKRLAALINDLMVVSEADSGVSRIRLETVAVVPIVQCVLSSLSATANTAQVELVLGGEISADRENIQVLADPLRLDQVLTNLVSNALKFTPSGGRVEVTINQRDAMIHIDIADTGIGIEKLAIQHVFERFYRAPMALEKSIRGSGLGLAIAKRMTEAQGGTLSARSVLGKGSTFTVTLAPAITPLTDVATVIDHSTTTPDCFQPLLGAA